MTSEASVQIAFLADYGQSYGKGLEISSIVEAACRTGLSLEAICRDSLIKTTADGQFTRSRYPLGAAPYRAFSWYGRKFAPAFKARLAQERMFDRFVRPRVNGNIPVFFGVPRLTKSFKRAREVGMKTILHAVELAPVHMREMILSLYGRGSYETNILGGAYIDDSEGTLQYVDYVFCHTEFSKRTYVAQGVPAEKIYVFPMGGNHVNRAAVVGRDYTALAYRRMKLVYVGNITRAKGCHLLLEAMDRMDPAEFELHLCGDADSDFKSDILKSRQPGSNVYFHGNVDPRPYYATSDIFVFPTLIDSFGRVVVEAASFGLPCIATEIGAASIVDNERTGLLIEPTVDSLMTALRQAKANGLAVAAWSAEITRRAAILTMDRFGESNVHYLAQVAGK